MNVPSTEPTTWQEFVNWWTYSKEEIAAAQKAAQEEWNDPDRGTLQVCRDHEDRLSNIWRRFSNNGDFLAEAFDQGCHWAFWGDQPMYEAYHIGTYGDGEKYYLCYDCSDQYSYESGYEETREEQVYHEMKNFTKFFRNWYFGFLSNEEIHSYNDTCFEDKQVLEIFEILKLYVMTDDESAAKLQKHMDMYKFLPFLINEIMEQ